jgi:multisubunit Na+/H+ antiporter MnhC subunit
MIDSYPLYVAAAALFFSGLAAMSTARNLVKNIMGFQVALFGVNLALFTAGLTNNSPSLFSSTLVVLSIIMGASVEAVALCLVILLYRRYGTLNPWKMRRLSH